MSLVHTVEHIESKMHGLHVTLIEYNEFQKSGPLL